MVSPESRAVAFGHRGATSAALALLSIVSLASPAVADWRDQQWVDMETGEMVGTDRANNPGDPQPAIPFVLNVTCSESSDRRAASCYFVRLSFLVDPTTKACNADVMVFREALTVVERSPSRVIWLAAGKPSLLTGEVLTHRLQVTFNSTAPRMLGQPNQADRWDYRSETFYPKNSKLNSTAAAANAGKPGFHTDFLAPCRPTAVGIQPFTSRRGAFIPE